MSEQILGLKKAVPYLRVYKGKTFVIKISGELITDKPALDNFAEQIALLHQIGINTVLVHGGGLQASDLSNKLGIPVEMVDGRRITSAAALDVVKMVFNGKLNTELLAALQKQKVAGVGLSGVDGGLICAQKRPLAKITDETSGKVREVDFGFVGDVVAINTGVITHLLDGSFVPVVSSLAGGENGEIYNVNADTVSSRLAAGLKAEKLIFVTNVPGVFKNKDDPASLISHMDLKRLDELLSYGAVGGMKVKLEASDWAIKQGVPRVHIISGLKNDSLLFEIFTNEGTGTLIEESYNESPMPK